MSVLYKVQQSITYNDIIAETYDKSRMSAVWQQPSGTHSRAAEKSMGKQPLVDSQLRSQTELKVNPTGDQLLNMSNLLAAKGTEGVGLSSVNPSTIGFESAQKIPEGSSDAILTNHNSSQEIAPRKPR